jgi:hypothetical protein
VADNTDSRGLGYGRPPSHTRFTKGKSGNPNGRPKGSQNLATVLAKAGRQRVRITENGRTRFITKFEATVLQMWNKAASGDLRAAAELHDWIKSFAEPEQTVLASAAPNENDQAVMTAIADRLRNSEPIAQDQTNDVPDVTETNPQSDKE